MTASSGGAVWLAMTTASCSPPGDGTTSLTTPCTFVSRVSTPSLSRTAATFVLPLTWFSTYTQSPSAAQARPPPSRRCVTPPLCVTRRGRTSSRLTSQRSASSPYQCSTSVFATTAKVLPSGAQHGSVSSTSPVESWRCSRPSAETSHRSSLL